ncbi:glycosyltransferase [Flavobacteriaceae bacterium]|nr:glycosyltransferase [Flavobacteriaceae bacterium]
MAIIMPTYNASRYLRRSIDSLLNQTFKNFDLFIQDDCSTDNSQQIIAEYKDDRIYYSRNDKNLGIAKSLNKVINRIWHAYEFIGRMDADDWCHPKRIEMQLEFLNSNSQCVLVGTQGYWSKNFEQANSSDWTYPENHNLIRYYLLFTACFGHSSVLIRSKIFSDHFVRYDENIKTSEDWEFWTRLIKIGELNNLSSFLMKYQIDHSSNHRISKHEELHLNETSQIISNYYAAFNLDINNRDIYNFYSCKNKFDYRILIKFIESYNFLWHNYIKNESIEVNSRMQYLFVRKIKKYLQTEDKFLFRAYYFILLLSLVEFAPKKMILKNYFT